LIEVGAMFSRRFFDGIEQDYITLKRELQSIPVPKETILSLLLLLLLLYWLSYSYFQHEIFSRELSKIMSFKSFLLSSFVAIFSMRFC
jgi:hypothetical protein